ncbi:MAG: hypothetical protein KAV70_04065 [Bacteroidales bacterium]|nr:hypothetical protein [Bacteroidales bacterium]MCK4407197.1 hypothetical protein [Bacteroidales bacterium]
MEDSNYQYGSQKTNKRPEFLSVLCILTFIGSGLAAFSNLIISLNYDSFIEIAQSEELTFPGIDLFLSLKVDFFIISFIFYSVSLFGAIQMWKLKKIGFHIYTVAQIILLIIPSIFAPSLEFPFLGLLITVLFIVLYAKNLKYMS